MKRLFVFTLLIAANCCFASQSDIDEKTDKAFVDWGRPLCPIRVSCYSDETWEYSLSLLTRGYQETGPCMGRFDLQVQRALAEVNMPHVLTSMVIEYFVLCKAPKNIEEVLENNWWALFEKYIGRNIIKNTYHIDAQQMYQIIAQQQGNRYAHNPNAIQLIIKRFLDDLQALTDIGYARNPYACITEMPRVNKEETCEFPQLLMHIPDSPAESVCKYISNSNSHYHFSRIGAIMLHTYTKYNAHYDGYESYNDRCLPRIGYTKTELTLHLHTPQPTPGIAHNIYYKDNTQMSEDYFEYHGGNVLLQAILYAQKRNPQRSKRCCACQCIML